MKRLLLLAAAGAMITGPLTIPAFAQQRQGEYQERRDDRGDQSRDRDGNRDQSRDRNGDWNNDRRDGDRNKGRNHREASRYHDNNSSWRDTRRNVRWNDRDHNGYYTGRTWHPGPPPARAYRQRGFQLGYQPWQRGQNLGYYNQRYNEVDYRDYNLQRPQQGYRWVQDDSGNLILAALAGGLIAMVIANN